MKTYNNLHNHRPRPPIGAEEDVGDGEDVEDGEDVGGWGRVKVESKKVIFVFFQLLSLDQVLCCAFRFLSFPCLFS